MRSWLSRHLDSWLRCWGSAFVMEIESTDGSRVLIGLDPNWQGAQAIAVLDDDAGWADRLVVPDDLRDLVP